MESLVCNNLQHKSIFEKIVDTISVNKIIDIKVPTNVLKRAELMCAYIEDDFETAFELENLIMLLYWDFIKYAVKNYNPSRVLKEANRKHLEKSDTLIVEINGQAYEMEREGATGYSMVRMKFPKKECLKGQLILDELESLYGQKILFETLISNLLINFIEDYKCGVNKRAYTSISKILKRTLS